jgi:hypothetical protein
MQIGNDKAAHNDSNPKMPRKQAIRRRMYSGRLNSSKICAGRDFKQDPSPRWKDQGGCPSIELDGYSTSDMRGR